MTSRRLFALSMLLLAFANCTITAPISSTPAKNNPGYDVEYLFEHDGCRVYRFRDSGNWVYFTNCRGEAISYPDSTNTIRNTTNIRKNH